jgi:intein-encoded DNA endonuclease-like protein
MATLIQSELEISTERLTPQWLAGFFDGEGCISITNRHNGSGVNYPRLSVTITQSEPTLLTLIGLKFTNDLGDVVCPVRKGTKKEKKPCYSLRMTGKNARPFLEYVRPYVILKRKLVEWAIEMTELTGERGRRDLLTPENMSRRTELMQNVITENSSKREISLVS